MKIYTSYFAKLKKLPENIIPIAICAKAPEWYTGLQYKKLAPKWWFFQEWKENHDNDFYIKNFKKDVLSGLNPKQVVEELIKLAEVKEGQDLCLLCFEKPEDFCHRHLVADWLTKNGIDTKELIL